MKYYQTLALIGATMLAAPALAANSQVVTGGVGEESRSVIQSLEQDHNLKLVFTGEGGMYLSGVGVTILDDKGERVVYGITQGPFLLADLKPGRYSLQADAEGHSKSMPITVGSKGLKSYTISFPIRDEDENVATLEQQLEQRGYIMGYAEPNYEGYEH